LGVAAVVFAVATGFVVNRFVGPWSAVSVVAVLTAIYAAVMLFAIGEVNGDSRDRARGRQ
jgi:hypothetical protein